MKIPDNCKVSLTVMPQIASTLNEVAEFAGISEDTVSMQIAKTLSACALLMKCFVRYAKDSGAVLLDEESLLVEMQLITESLGGNPSVDSDMPKINTSFHGVS